MKTAVLLAYFALWALSSSVSAQPASLHESGDPSSTVLLTKQPFPFAFALDSVKIGDAVASSQNGYPLSLWLDGEHGRKRVPLIRGHALNRQVDDLPLAAYSWPTGYQGRGWLAMSQNGRFYWVNPSPKSRRSYHRLYSWSAYPFLDSLKGVETPQGFYGPLSTTVIPTQGQLHAPIEVKIRIPDSESHIFYLIYQHHQELIPYNYREGEVYTWIVSPGQRTWLFGYEPTSDSGQFRFVLKKLMTRRELMEAEMETLTGIEIAERVKMLVE
ncbi:MAG: hypothetical protein AAFQ98_14485 [Bacteroidota bacterium]